MPGKHNAGGCGCCGDDCIDCSLLYAKYGYTGLAVSGVAGSRTLYDGSGNAGTWAGFTAASLTIPAAQGGPCDDSIIQNIGMAYSATWFLNNTATPPGFRLTPTGEKASLIASNIYSCVEIQDKHELGMSVGYYCSSLGTFSEASFPDWTWTAYGTGRRGTKAIGSATATYIYVPASPFGHTLSGGIAQSAIGGIAATSLTLPSFPYDPFGIMVGSVTIS